MQKATDRHDNKRYMAWAVGRKLMAMTMTKLMIMMRAMDIPGKPILIETLEAERFHRFGHVVDGTIGSVVSQVSSLLKLLPNDPDLVCERVMEEEDGIISRILQGGQRVILMSPDKEVQRVVHDLELDLA